MLSRLFKSRARFDDTDDEADYKNMGITIMVGYGKSF